MQFYFNLQIFRPRRHKVFHHHINLNWSCEAGNRCDSQRNHASKTKLRCSEHVITRKLVAMKKKYASLVIDQRMFYQFSESQLYRNLGGSIQGNLLYQFTKSQLHNDLWATRCKVYRQANHILKYNDKGPKAYTISWNLGGSIQGNLLYQFTKSQLHSDLWATRSKVYRQANHILK